MARLAADVGPAGLDMIDKPAAQFVAPQPKLAPLAEPVEAEPWPVQALLGKQVEARDAFAAPPSQREP